MHSTNENYLKSKKGEGSKEPASELKEVVRFMFKNVVEPLDQLEFIDHLQRLGVAYHFFDEIERALKKIHSDDTNNDKWERNLHATALRFRLLREHGYDVSQGNNICT